MDEIVNLYINGLPHCRAEAIPHTIRLEARQENIKIACSMLKSEALRTVEFLKKRGYNAYLREGESRGDLCEPSFMGDYYEEEELPQYKSTDRWFGDE